MGWKSRYVRSVVSPPKPKKQPLPQRAMATVGGVTHRLSWLDRHAGYRMRCSCGWADAAVRSTERSAINNGNSHVVGVRRAEVTRQQAAVKEQRRRAQMAKTPQQRQSDKRKTTRRVGIAVLVIAALITVDVLLSHLGHNSYNDGYAWGNANVDGVIVKTGPACLRIEMTSSSDNLSDPNYIIEKKEGAGQPNDNFKQWRAGCEAGVRAALNGYAADGNTGATPDFNSGSTGNTGNTGG